MKFFIFPILVLFFTSSLAQTLKSVPSAEFPTIQAAIDLAVDGDTVLVNPGTYYEGIDFKVKIYW